MPNLPSSKSNTLHPIQYHFKWPGKRLNTLVYFLGKKWKCFVVSEILILIMDFPLFHLILLKLPLSGLMYDCDILHCFLLTKEFISQWAHTQGIHCLCLLLFLFYFVLHVSHYSKAIHFIKEQNQISKHRVGTESGWQGVMNQDSPEGGTCLGYEFNM